jgi:hypothetical protein
LLFAVRSILIREVREELRPKGATATTVNG